MKQKFAEAFKTFKKEVYKVEHDPNELESLTKDALNITEDALDNAYHYHFHKLPDADRAEIINMINNYTREAVLPPVVEKLVMRQVKLERRFEALLGLTEQVLELLSTDPSEGRAEKAAS